MNKLIKRVDSPFDALRLLRASRQPAVSDRRESNPSTVVRKTLLFGFFLALIGQKMAIGGETKTPTPKETPVKKESAKKDLTVADVTQKVEEAQAAVEDAQMDLQMEMKDSLSGAQQNSKGAVKMKSPDKIFVHYTQPTEQFLYIGGSLTQMYQPDQKTLYQRHNGKGKEAAPVYLGVGKQLKKYVEISKVTLYKNSDNEVGLQFIPNDKMTAGFDKMKVLIHKKDWWPYEIEMETPAMNSKVKFSNISFNQGLKENLFKFIAPKDVQVVEGAVF